MEASEIAASIEGYYVPCHVCTNEPVALKANGRRYRVAFSDTDLLHQAMMATGGRPDVDYTVCEITDAAAFVERAKETGFGIARDFQVSNDSESFMYQVLLTLPNNH